MLCVCVNVLAGVRTQHTLLCFPPRGLRVVRFSMAKMCRVSRVLIRLDTWFSARARKSPQIGMFGRAVERLC